MDDLPHVALLLPDGGLEVGVVDVGAEGAVGDGHVHDAPMGGPLLDGVLRHHLRVLVADPGVLHVSQQLIDLKHDSLVYETFCQKKNHLPGVAVPGDVVAHLVLHVHGEGVEVMRHTVWADVGQRLPHGLELVHQLAQLGELGELG